jgi:hypothetical protein
MAYFATNKFVGDGVTTKFEVLFAGGYIDKSHIFAYIDNLTTRVRTPVAVTLGMFVGPNTINLGVSAPVGSAMVIYRDTPKSAPLVDFVNGSRITEANLDKVAQQGTFIGAEQADLTVDALRGSQEAAASAEQARVSAAAAAAIYDSFDDRYLGPKEAAPTLDNDGEALLVGALYWDTAIPGMRSYVGGASPWTTLPAATAGAVANTPAGGVTETTVQGAIDGLETRKANVAAIQAQTYTAFTTGGTATAYTLTPSPALAALAAGQRFSVKFNAVNTSTTPTLAISGLAAKAVKVYNTAGMKIDPVVGGLALDMLADVEYDGTDYVVRDALKTTATTALPTVTATVAADALTLGMAAKPLDFRSATLASGVVTTLLAKPANIVVPSGATLGTVNAVKNRLVVGVMNVAGVAELFVMNAILGNYLDESQLITTTVLDAASDSAEVPYSTTARTAMPFRILGYVESTQATAGVWATAPTLIQGFGAGAEIVQQVSFRAHQSTAQAIAATTVTKLLFQTENYDIGGKFADSAFTATEPGIYYFSVSVAATNADGQRMFVGLNVNGTLVVRVVDVSAGAAGNGQAAGSTQLRLRAGDVVEATIWYSVAEDTVVGTASTYFSGHRIG